MKKIGAQSSETWIFGGQFGSVGNFSEIILEDFGEVKVIEN